MEKAKATKYTKEQLLKSRCFATRVDLLGVLLKDGETYTVEETDSLLQKILKGKVN